MELSTTKDIFKNVASRLSKELNLEKLTDRLVQDVVGHLTDTYKDKTANPVSNRKDSIFTTKGSKNLASSRDVNPTSLLKDVNKALVNVIDNTSASAQKENKLPTILIDIKKSVETLVDIQKQDVEKRANLEKEKTTLEAKNKTDKTEKEDRQQKNKATLKEDGMFMPLAKKLKDIQSDVTKYKKFTESFLDEKNKSKGFVERFLKATTKAVGRKKEVNEKESAEKQKSLFASFENIAKKIQTVQEKVTTFEKITENIFKEDKRRKTPQSILEKVITSIEKANTVRPQLTRKSKVPTVLEKEQEDQESYVNDPTLLTTINKNKNKTSPTTITGSDTSILSTLLKSLAENLKKQTEIQEKQIRPQSVLEEEGAERIIPVSVTKFVNTALDQLRSIMPNKVLESIDKTVSNHTKQFDKIIEILDYIKTNCCDKCDCDGGGGGIGFPIPGRRGPRGGRSKGKGKNQ